MPRNLSVSKISWEEVMEKKLEGNHYVEQPDLFGPQWLTGFNVTPVVPNIFERWIRGD